MTVESIRSNTTPHIACATIARAERLVLAGAGWSADQVLRRALDLLEARHKAHHADPDGRAFTRDEIAAALAGHDCDTDISSTDARYLRALAAILTPDPHARPS